MKFVQYKDHLEVSGRGIFDITTNIAEYVKKAEVLTGLCHIFLHHTSASLILCENADPLVQSDLSEFFAKLVPDNNPLFQHVAEGPDDMPSHVRTILTSSFLQIPISAGKLGLGTWQGIYLWEHRWQSRHRHMTITIQGV